MNGTKEPTAAASAPEEGPGRKAENLSPGMAALMRGRGPGQPTGNEEAKRPAVSPGLNLVRVSLVLADLLLVAAVLYVLWPARVPMGYWQVLGIYMLVFVTGVLTHVPGGYAVMETMLIWIISQILVISGSQQKDVLAAWLLFRVIYYIAPLCCSLVLLGCYEMVLHHRARKALASQPAEGGAEASNGQAAPARPHNSVDS